MPPKKPSKNTSPSAASKKKPPGKPLSVKPINENADGNASSAEQPQTKSGKGKNNKENEEPAPIIPIIPKLETTGTMAETAVQVLNTQEEAILAMLLDALLQYATKNERKQTILVELDVLPKLIGLFENPSRNVRRKAVRLFAMLAGIPAAATHLTKLPFIDALKKFTVYQTKKRVVDAALTATPPGGPISNTDNDVIMRLYATHMFASLCSHSQLATQIVDNVGVECLMEKLNDSLPEVQFNCLSAIRKLISSSTCRDKVLNAVDVFPPCIALFESPYPALQQLALETVIVAVDHPLSKRRLLDNNACEALVSFLTNKDYMYSSDGDADDDAAGTKRQQDEAFYLFHKLVQHPETGSEIVTRGIMKSFYMRILDERDLETLKIHRFCSACVAHLAQDSENVRVLHEQNVDDYVVQQLQLRSFLVHRAALEAISVMATFVPSKRRIGDTPGALRTIARLAADSASPFVQEMALLALSLLVVKDTHNIRHVLNNMPVVKQTLNLLASFVLEDKPSLHNNNNSPPLGGGERRSTRKLACFGRGNAAWILDAQIVGGTVNVPEVAQRVAANALALLTSLSKSNQMKVLAEKYNLASQLTAFLDHSSCSNNLITRALAAVCAFCQTPPTRETFFQHRGATCLAQLLACAEQQPIQQQKHNATLICACLQTIAVLCADATAAAALFGAGIFGNLVRLEQNCQQLLLSVKEDEEDVENVVELLDAVVRRTLAKLLSNNLPAKYAVVGRIDACDFVHHGFYDYGDQSAVLDTMSPEVKTLDVLIAAPPKATGTTVYISVIDGNDDGGSDVKTDEDEQEEAEADDDDLAQPSRPNGGGVAELLKKNKEREKNLSVVTSNMLLYDENLVGMINEATTLYRGNPDPRAIATGLARTISFCMGGNVQREQLPFWSNSVHIAELKQHLQSNCIPLGRIKHGDFQQRALMFKVIADRVGLSTSLHRGVGCRAWNVLYVETVDNASAAADEQTVLQQQTTERFVVDVMHQAGSLYQYNSWAARMYCCPERHAPLERHFLTEIFNGRKASQQMSNKPKNLKGRQRRFTSNLNLHLHDDEEKKFKADFLLPQVFGRKKVRKHNNGKRNLHRHSQANDSESELDNSPHKARPSWHKLRAMLNKHQSNQANGRGRNGGEQQQQQAQHDAVMLEKMLAQFEALNADRKKQQRHIPTTDAT